VILDSGEKERLGLMVAMDRLNESFGRGAVVIGSAGLKGARRPWVMKQEFRTPGYTTNWVDMPIARS
jgi:DNA polymerase V